MPAARLDGFDISADQYPPKEWLPGNISLSLLDIQKAVPEELVGQYDMVHVRLFLTVVQKDDPSTILKNLTDMLSQWVPIHCVQLVSRVQSLAVTFSGPITTLQP